MGIVVVAYREFFAVPGVIGLSHWTRLRQSFRFAAEFSVILMFIVSPKFFMMLRCFGPWSPFDKDSNMATQVDKFFFANRYGAWDKGNKLLKTKRYPEGPCTRTGYYTVFPLPALPGYHRFKLLRSSSICSASSHHTVLASLRQKEGTIWSFFLHIENLVTMYCRSFDGHLAADVPSNICALGQTPRGHYVRGVKPYA